SGDRIAAQLAADRRRRPTHLCRNLSDREPRTTQILQLLSFEKTDVSAINDFLHDVQVDASADRAGSSFGHVTIVLLGVTHDTTIWIDPASLDDSDALIPVG